MVKREIRSYDEKLSYALGMSLGSNLINAGVSTLDTVLFSQAVTDLFQGLSPAMTPEEANEVLDSFMNSKGGQDASDATVAGTAFMAENGARKEVVSLPSGLQYEVITSGDGDFPGPNDRVRCHYHGTLIDGTVFDSSVQRGNPADFPVSGVIQGWIEALQLMQVGSKYRLFIPPHLAYGERGAGGSIGPNSTLIFEVELLEIL